MTGRAAKGPGMSKRLFGLLRGRPSATAARPLSLAALLVLLLGGGAVEGLLWQDVAAMQDMIAARQDHVAGLKRWAERLTAPVAGSVTRTPAASPFLPGETDTIAAAEFQAQVLKILEDNKATVLSAQVRLQAFDATHDRTPLDEATGQRIKLDVIFDVRNVDLQKILFMIETGRPILVISDLKMQPALPTDGRDTRAEDPDLHVVLGILGVWRKV